MKETNFKNADSEILKEFYKIFFLEKTLPVDSTIKTECVNKVLNFVGSGWSDLIKKYAKETHGLDI